MRSEIISIIIGMALVTLLTRAAGLLFNMKSNAVYERWLKHIPTAMLTALIIPSLLMPRGTLFISLRNPYIMAGIVSVLIAVKTKSIFATVGFGMITMLLLQGFVI
ncbi:MAG: AzlD domain-containing protein [Firmicutes bacterium]|nr:AzlD domain-containing protein [Bacillota bacterium]